MDQSPVRWSQRRIDWVALGIGAVLGFGAGHAARMPPVSPDLALAGAILTSTGLLPFTNGVTLLVAARVVPPQRCGLAAVLALYFLLLPLALLLLGPVWMLLWAAVADAAR